MSLWLVFSSRSIYKILHGHIFFTFCVLSPLVRDFLDTNHRHVVAQHGINGHSLSQLKMAKFDPTELIPLNQLEKLAQLIGPQDYPLCQISCKSAYRGLLSKCKKYNKNLVYFIILFWTLTYTWIFTCDGSNDMPKGKGCLSGFKNSKLIFTS